MATRAEYAIIGVVATVFLGGALVVAGVVVVAIHFAVKFWWPVLAAR